MTELDSKDALECALRRIQKLHTGRPEESDGAKARRCRELAAQYAIGEEACRTLGNAAVRSCYRNFEHLTRWQELDKEHQETLEMELDLFIAQIHSLTPAELYKGRRTLV